MWFGFPRLLSGPPCFSVRVGRFPVFAAVEAAMSFLSFAYRPLLWACVLSGRVGSVPDGNWVLAWDLFGDRWSSLPCIDFPYGPVTVRGLSLRQRLALWSFLLDHLLPNGCYELSWSTLRSSYRYAFEALFVALFRGWR